MSFTESPAAAAVDPSLRGRLAGRRQALQQKEPVLLPVPGYEDILYVKYHAVDYRVLRRIGMRQADNPDVIESEINVAADTLVNACDGLLEVPEGWDGDVGGLVPTGHSWSVQSARDLFGVPESDLPDGSTSRQALLRVIPDHTDVILHYADYDKKSREVRRKAGRELEGESEAGSAVA